MARARTYNQTGVNVRGAGYKVKPTRDRAVNVRAVDCPDCPALVDGPCLMANGEPYPSGHTHRARRRMALRAEREQS